MNYRTTPEAVALAKAIPDTNDAIWKWSLKMDGSVSLESDPTPVHAAIRILAAECDALEKERDEWAEKWADLSRASVADVAKIEKERDALLEALRAISVADWKTAGELRGMARIAAKGAQE